MSGVQIQAASGISLSRLCDAMNAAFSDYVVPMSLTLHGFEQVMRQRGLSPSASRIAVQDDRIVAIWLVSVRANAGYLISSGTVPDHRGRGLASALARSCLAALEADSFQTDVIVGNDTAARLYERLGMMERRRLACHSLPRQGSDVPLPSVRWGDICGEARALRDWTPSWQNSDTSLTALGDDLDCIALRDERGLAAYAAVIRSTGTLAQIGVRPDRRRTGLGLQMVRTLNRPLRVINSDASDLGFSRFLTDLGGDHFLDQRELFMELHRS